MGCTVSKLRRTSLRLGRTKNHSEPVTNPSGQPQPNFFSLPRELRHQILWQAYSIEARIADSADDIDHPIFSHRYIINEWARNMKEVDERLWEDVDFVAGKWRGFFDTSGLEIEGLRPDFTCRPPRLVYDERAGMTYL